MKLRQRWMTTVLTLMTALAPSRAALADPCGMVPPIWLGDGAPITRVGVQKTYAFYKDGIETLVLRPGFTGKVDEFGMLIPFPSPPAMRKVGEDVFAHLAAAVDPPEVVVDLRQREVKRFCNMAAPTAVADSGLMVGRMRKEQVVVLRREAVGMYEVAVLEAGSAAALKVWMDEHGFRYPEGMDATCEEYVEDGWCFVAIRARVGQKSGSDPRPGMRSVDTTLPPGAGFDGHVQAMGFRFRTDEFVVPMRLSAFNPGELRNVMYILTDSPQRVANLAEEFVVRQIPGAELLANVTEPLPLRLLGGDLEDIPEWRRKGLAQERDPRPHSGIARGLFAADLLAVRDDRLAHPHEEDEKTLLEIGERLGLRGPGLDPLHHDAVRERREAVVAGALAGLPEMTLTVVDGDFPRELLAAENLSFTDYAMPADSNDAARWDAKHLGPAPVQTGSILGGGLGGPSGPLALAIGTLILLAALSALLRGRTALTAVAATALVGVSFGLPRAESPPVARTSEERVLALVEDFAYPIADPETMRVLAACGAPAIPRLLQEALSDAAHPSRGWAVVALTEIGGDRARGALLTIEKATPSPLVRTWAQAAQVRLATGPAHLVPISQRVGWDTNLERPLVLRWSELLATSDAESEDELIEGLLEALSHAGNLQQALLPAVLGRGTDPLIRALTTAASDNARNLAAGALATLAGQGEAAVPGAVLAAYRFDPEAETAPWEGGPLFVPGLAWTASDARELTDTLMAWFVWCDVRGRSAACTQIHNNLRSVSLAQAAGYETPGWHDLDVVQWLGAYGKAYGAEALAELLEGQGVHEVPRYASALNRLEEG